jgi:hypothetical protein
MPGLKGHLPVHAVRDPKGRPNAEDEAMTDMPSLTPANGAARNKAVTGRAPEAQGLYDPRFEHDACGVGFIANMKGVKSHQIVRDGLAMLENLTHRGAVGADPLMGDGAGLLVQIPDRFLRAEMAKQGIELPPSGGSMASATGSCRRTRRCASTSMPSSPSRRSPRDCR